MAYKSKDEEIIEHGTVEMGKSKISVRTVKNKYGEKVDIRRVETGDNGEDIFTPKGIRINISETLGDVVLLLIDALSGSSDNYDVLEDIKDKIEEELDGMDDLEE